MSKQDRYASRTVADLERKYNFGQTFANVYGLVDDVRRMAEEAQSAFDGLNQEQIFNLLTNFGEAQGLYRDDVGGVYINASYIKSGTISGDNVKVAAATVTGELTAATITADKISGGELDFEKVTATNLVVGAASIELALKASTIEASQIKGGVLDFDLVTAKNLTVTDADIAEALSASTISADNIRGGTISASDISGVSITGGTIKSTSIDSASIKAAAITGSSISGTSITGSQFVATSNLGYGYVDSCFTVEDGWGYRIGYIGYSSDDGDKLWVRTVNSSAIKISAAGNVSVESGYDTVYVGAPGEVQMESPEVRIKDGVATWLFSGGALKRKVNEAEGYVQVFP